MVNDIYSLTRLFPDKIKNETLVTEYKHIYFWLLFTEVKVFVSISIHVLCHVENFTINIFLEIMKSIYKLASPQLFPFLTLLGVEVF